MSSKPVKYNFGCYVEEDSVDIRVFTIVRIDNGVTLDDPLVGAEVRLTIRDKDSEIVEYFSTEMTVTGSTITTPMFYCPPEGVYNYDLQVYFSDGVRRTTNYGNLVSTKGVTREDST